ncbi:MAG: ATP-binding cassette domain-containing protein [Candidatus Micrarchaeota archaeon]|nr:ATP-binding cassette domain-containing protein [Candidatus Micrarchaeota archaeon]
METKQLDFSYDGKTKALAGIDFAVPRGKKTVVLGPNGSGKSTLFLNFNGVHRPDSGEVLYDGQPLAYDGASLTRLRANVSLVFQNPDDQIFSATVEEDVAFGPMNLSLPREEVEKRVDDALSWVGMEELRERPTQQLSFGQRKRVSIAGALAMRPQVLIMDEPTAGLDPQMVHELMELSDELNHQGITVVISTHDLETAYEWADEVRAMEKGRMVFSGKPEEFFENDELVHRMGMSRPTILEVNRHLHAIQGKPMAPYPRNLTELLHKAFPAQTGKKGKLRLACVDKGETMPLTREAHAHSGIYGALARKLTDEGKLDPHYRFHALEYGIMEASMGHDFTLYTEEGLCDLAQERVERLEKAAGIHIDVEHSHSEKKEKKKE